MIRIFFCLMILNSCFLLHVTAQQMLSSKEMIAITPVVPSGIDIPVYAKKPLEQRLRQIATQNGFGATSGEFVLTANILLLDKQTTPTAPPMHRVQIEVSLYVANVAEQILIDEIAVEATGVGRSDSQAYTMAINQINPRTPTVRNFMNQCRKKIIDYYTTRIPALLAKAKSQTERKQYDQALATLSVVPESVDEYPAIAEQMSAIYIQKLDLEADILLQKVNAEIAKKNYGEAINLLIKIDPASTRFTKAGNQIQNIRQKMEAAEKAEAEAKLAQLEAEREAQQKMRDDELMLAKIRLEAAQKAGTEYRQTEEKNSSLEDIVGKWLLGKFKS